MPRFHFNDQNGERHLDKTGVVLADAQEARVMAIKTLGTIVSEHPEQFWEKGEWSMTVTNDAGLTLFQIVTFAIDGAVQRR